jgi:hypothetical protein
MQTETIDRLFLELSQVTGATTAKELALLRELNALRAAVSPFAAIVNETSGRIPTERLSLANWHDLVRAFNEGPNARF